MKRFGVLIFVSAFISLTGIGKDWMGSLAVTSRQSVKQALERMDVRVGSDLERGRIVAIGTSGFSMKGEESDGKWGLKETYDFPDEAGDDYETRRFKAVWKAYADGLAKIASDLLMSVEHKETKDESGKTVSQALKSSAVQALAGVVTITMAESCTVDGGYEVTVAVCQSQKRAEAYSRGLNDGDAKHGKLTLDEWVKQKSESGSGMICPQSYCDNEGVWWRVAGVPVDLSTGRNSNKVVVSTEKAKRYAIEAAMRTIAVRVSTSTSTTISISPSECGKQEYATDEKMDRTVKIEPMDAVLPVNPSQVRWFELDRSNPLTGNPVRCVVAALRSGRGLAGTKQKTGIGDMCVRKGTALDQAKAYLEQKGWQTGRDFALANKSAVAIGGVSFKYSSSLDDADFAKKRYEAVQQALMEAAVAIPMQVSEMMEDAAVDELSREWLEARRRLDSWRLSMRNLEMVFEDDDQEWFSHLFTKTAKRDFSWEVKFGKSESQDEKNTMAKFYVLGLSVMGQFESLSGDTYQVALVVSLDVGKGKERIMAFSEGKVEVPGKMSLQQWMDTQDFSLIAGPRQYVDNEGTRWALGIVPATEGQQPYGALLDAAARECAAFAFGGDVRVSHGESGGSLEFSATDVSSGYPHELEKYFRRPYTHSVTGRKGVVAICALRSGASMFMKEIVVRRINETVKKQREEGMRAAMLDMLKRPTETLREVREKVYGVDVAAKLDMAKKLRVEEKLQKVERKLSRLTDELQEKRRLNSERQKYFTEKIVTISQEIAEVEQLIQKFERR